MQQDNLFLKDEIKTEEETEESSSNDEELPDVIIDRPHSKLCSFDGGLLIVWGCGEFGQHGHGHCEDVPIDDALACPLWLGQDRMVVEVACGSSHTIVLTGTLGQPKIWDITNPASYQHPMAPYDVLVDPQTVPYIPKIKDPEELASEDDSKESEKVNELDSQSIPYFSSSHGKDPLVIDEHAIAEELKKSPWREGCGKRLRHERLKKVPRDVGGPSAYQTLTCFELEDTPALPNPPSSSSIDDPFDIRI